ncbi:MAG: PhnD/SsuA/transferrin family substrate-binding protein, partial [bacterium]
IDPDVYMMCHIMLEPAALNQQELGIETCDTYIQVAKMVLQDNCQIGFFLLDAYNDLSSMVKSQLRPIITSDIQVVHHVMMISPKLATQQSLLTQALVNMKSSPKDLITLESLELSAFEEMTLDEAEMMIDLMDTLNEYSMPS